ncbi:MAG: thioredoxin [Clostridia bacterium]|nr:thioredoxin [Clostridia bacterium]
MSEVIVTAANFEAQVLQSDKPVLVDFWATWCMPCRMLAPVVAQIAEELEGKAVVGKVDVDEEGELAAQFNVSSIPTLVVFKGGKEVARTVGVQDKAALLNLLNV